MTDKRRVGYGEYEWLPSCPLPLYVRSWRTLFQWRYQCQCGVVFDDETVYKAHWFLEHSGIGAVGSAMRTEADKP